MMARVTWGLEDLRDTSMLPRAHRRGQGIGPVLLALAWISGRLDLPAWGVGRARVREAGWACGDGRKKDCHTTVTMP
jgi:hypothetical protein